jgi:hypothetical protein
VFLLLFSLILFLKLVSYNCDKISLCVICLEQNISASINILFRYFGFKPIIFVYVYVYLYKNNNYNMCNIYLHI